MTTPLPADGTAGGAVPARLSVTLRRDGTVSAHTLDVTGVACLDSVALLEDLLDGTIVHSELTSDYVAAPVGLAGTQAAAHAVGEREEQPDTVPHLGSG